MNKKTHVLVVGFDSKTWVRLKSERKVEKAVPEPKGNGIEGIGLYQRGLSVEQKINSKGGC
jgi:hypothetical protein